MSTVVQSAAFALSNLARGEQVVAEEMIRAGIAPLILNLLSPGKHTIDVVGEVAWVLSYLTAKPDCVPVFVSGGIISILVSFLNSLAQESPHNSQVVTPMLRSLGKTLRKQFISSVHLGIQVACQLLKTPKCEIL